MNDGRPLVSVLLPVYNGAAYLEQAIQSVLDQTYRHFEVIIVNDGSTDESGSIIENFGDERIRLYNQQNQGLAASLNRAIELSNGKYLARQDQDDVSFPERFVKQVLFMENHPGCGMVGTWASIWEQGRPTDRAHNHPVEDLAIKFDLLFDNPFVHSSTMIRKEAIDKAGPYTTDKTRQPPEDYELWSRISREFEVANIPEILHVYREMPQSMSRVGPNPFLDKVVNISAENLAWYAGRRRVDRHALDLAALYHSAYHRLSPGPSFRGMRQYLLDAVGNLSRTTGADNSQLRPRIAACLRHVRRNYVHYRYGGKLDSLLLHLERISGVFGAKFIARLLA